MSVLLKRRVATLLLLSTALFLLIWVVLPPFHLHADEHIHFMQSWSFSKNRLVILEDLSTWPTLNFIVGMVIKWWPWPYGEIAAARSTVALFAVGVAWGAFVLLERSCGTAAWIRVLQLITLPVILPFCVLIYTDIPALCGLTWAVVGLQKRNWKLFLTAMAVAMAFRQLNISWLIIGCIYFVSNNSTNEKYGQCDRRKVLIGGLILFLIWTVIVLKSGGISIGEKTQGDHFLNMKGLPNIYFLFFLCFLFYSPQWLIKVYSAKFYSGIFRKIPLLGLLTVCVAVTFEVNHPSNTNVIPLFLRNNFLNMVSHGPELWIFSTLSALGMMGMVAEKFSADYKPIKNYFWLAALASLLPLWLIEQRYYIPVLCLFMFFRQAKSLAEEWALLMVNCILSAVLLYFIAQGRYFI